MQRILIILLMFAPAFLFAQDEKAKELLDSVSEKTKSYATLRAKFNYNVQNQKEKNIEEHKGTLYLKGEKYKLFFMGNEIFFNGKTLTSFSIELNEATITNQEEGEDSMNPVDMFMVSEEDYFYVLMGDEEIDGQKYALIELIPSDRKKSEVAKLKVWINREKSELFRVKTIGKNGMNFVLTVTELKPEIKIIDKLFEFDAAAHPDVEVIDMR